MYDKKIERLIDLALADGELTEKEKQVLFNRAEEEGIDLDEFEMVLEARLFEVTKDKKVSAAPKSDKFGDIRKCPACGAIVESFSTRCSDCGTELRNIEVDNSVVKFFEKLEAIETKRYGSFSSDDSLLGIFGLGGISKILSWPYNALRLSFSPTPKKWSEVDVKKEELVINFPIPNAKETIFEFLTLSVSKIDAANYFNALSETMNYKNAWNKIWLKKIDQIETKANLSMKNDPKALEEIKNLAMGARQIMKENTKKMYISLGVTMSITIAILLYFFL